MGENRILRPTHRRSRADKRRDRLPYNMQIRVISHAQLSSRTDGTIDEIIILEIIILYSIT